MTNKTPGQIILDAVADGQYNAASEIMSAELFSNVNECMCQRKEKVASDFGQDISEGDSAYDAFFKKAMKKFGISSPADLKGEEEKKKFFNYIDKNFKASNEELEEETYPPIPPEDTPFGKAGQLVSNMLAVLGDRFIVSPTDIQRRKKGKVRPAPGLGPVRFTTAFDPAPTVPTGSDPFLPRGEEEVRDEEEYEYEMDMGMMDRDDEEEYEYEMDMMSVMPDDEEDGKPDQAYPPRRIKDQGGPAAMQGQMPMGAAPGKMMGGMKPPMQGMGQGMQMNPQMIAKMMQMMKKRKGEM